MFSFKKKSLNLIAPLSGKTVDLSLVPDPVFAEKMVGDGIAIQSTGDTVVAPCDGTLTLIMDTKHAFAITTDKGAEILVHVGLETVSLKGEGFTALIEAGKPVKAGTPILKLDLEFLASKNINMITPVLISNMNIIKSMTPLTDIDVTLGKDEIITYTI